MGMLKKGKVFKFRRQDFFLGAGSWAATNNAQLAAARRKTQRSAAQASGSYLRGRTRDRSR
jgi:hypothetical protein